MSMELGVPLDGSGYTAALDVNPDRSRGDLPLAPGAPVRHLRQREPALGHVTPHNVVVYRYFQDGGMAYLSDIYDTTPVGAAATDDLGSYAHHTQLFYRVAPDVTVSYRSGWPIEQRRRLLAQVAVSSQPFTAAAERKLVRRYHLAYDGDYHQSLLQSVTVEGRCAGSEDGAQPEPSDRVAAARVRHAAAHDLRLHATSPATTRLATRRRATLAGYEAIDERIREIASSPPHSLDEELSSLFDINSDGLPDVLVTAPGLYGDGHGYFLNGPGAVGDSFDDPQDMGIQGVLGANATTIKLSNLNLAPLDLDGDATHRPAAHAEGQDLLDLHAGSHQR